MKPCRQQEYSPLPRHRRHNAITPRRRSSQWTVVVALVTLLALVCISTPRVVDARMHATEMKHLRERAREMFYHGYNNYMDHAFPWDELKPLSCEGRRWDRRERGDLDDVLGGYALTLVDSLDMLAVLGDRDEFKRAVELVIETVHFDRDVTVSVFESTIRVIGGLLSAHLIASPAHLGVLTEEEYDGELLALAVDLGQRLLPAFDTPTQIPVHRINLKRGVIQDTPVMTCPAAAGSLLVEFAYLSRLSNLPIFEEKARNAVVALWLRRSELNLLGSSIDVNSGEWLTSHVGIGAGLDSYFEYLLKYHLVSGNSMWLEMFNMSYSAVETHMNHDDFHIEVDMHHGRRAVRSQRVSALQAFWPGLQVLAGEVSSAMRSYDKLFLLWNKFSAMPEIFDLGKDGGVISWARTSPLRPELIESTYHLYQATRDHKYLKIGRKLLEDIERVSRVPCGYAAVGDIHTLAVEDRMDSYFLSETVKYLYLLFRDDPDIIVPPMALPSRGGDSTSNHSSLAAVELGLGLDTVVEATGCCLNGSLSSAGLGNVTLATATVRTKPRFSRALKSSEVVFSTEGHILLVDARLFERDPSHKNSELQQTLACENGNVLAQQAKRRDHHHHHNQQQQQEQEQQQEQQQQPPSRKTKAKTKTNAKTIPTTLTFRPVGVSVRVGDAHIQTVVAAPATFGFQLGRVGHVEAPLLLFNKQIGDACEPLVDTEMELQVAGKIVFATRGGQCSFAEKALNVQQAGGLGIIIINKKLTTLQQQEQEQQQTAMSVPMRDPPRYVITDDDAAVGASVAIPLVMISRQAATELHRAVRLQLQLLHDDGDGDAAIAASGCGGGNGEGGIPLDDMNELLDGEPFQVVASLSAWLH